MKKIIFVIGGIATLLLIVFLVYTIEFSSWDFRNNLWAPAYLLWHQKSAYAITVLFPDSNALWFPQIITLFSPLGLLPQYQAANLWLGINIVLLIILTWYLIRRVSKAAPRPILFGITVLAVFLFPPMIRHLILGQVDAVILAAVIFGTVAFDKRRFALGSVLFAVALAKPQLCILVLPNVLGYFLFIRKERLNALKILLGICGFAFLLAIPFWINNPGWGYALISNINRNPQWSQPSMYSLLSTKLGLPGGVLWFLLFLLACGFTMVLWSKLNPISSVLWSLALTTIVSPYVWSWDFTLLLPLLMDTAFRIKSTLARYVLFCFYAFSLVYAVVSLLSIKNAGDDVLWWFPVVTMIGIVLSLILNRETRRFVLDGSGYV